MVFRFQAAVLATEELERLLELGATDDEGTELLVIAWLEELGATELLDLLEELGVTEVTELLELFGVSHPIRSLPTTTSSNQPSTPLLCW